MAGFANRPTTDSGSDSPSGILFKAGLLFLYLMYASQANAAYFDARVARIIDGDSLLLRNGETIRLIGINTPELDPEERASYPIAVAAKRYLQQLTHTGKIQYQLGPDSHDHYGRLLASVRGYAGIDLTAALLRKGLGYVIAIPPNIERLDYYISIEAIARQARLGLWSKRYLKLIDAARVSEQDKGFRLLVGRLTGLNSGKRNIRIHMGSKLTLIMSQKTWQTYGNIHQPWPIGKKYIIRGWLTGSARRGFVIQLKHPSALISWNCFLDLSQCK